MSSKTLSQTLIEKMPIPERLKPHRRNRLGQISKIVGYVALTAVGLGIAFNLPDIKRYVRMTLM
jgi:hypothetical protein